jgi:branched-chain amino acid transport system ATP-binding protein
MSQVLLQAKNLTMQFGGVTAVQNITFDVYEGEILGLIGPNGAGKTTILNMMSGLFTPTVGEILYKGKRISGLKPWDIAQLGLSRTFQVVKPFEGMSVLENVATGAMFGPVKMKGKAALAKAEEVLVQVGLDHKKQFGAGELTIADRKRLELGRALAMGPQVLLLDEVMAGLNLAEVDKLMRLVQEINATGVTVIMIEHVMKAVMGISHRVVVLHYGRLLATGAPEEVVANAEVIEAYLGRRFKGGEAS